MNILNVGILQIVDILIINVGLIIKLLKNNKGIRLLHDSSVDYAVHPNNVGLKALLTEGTPVGYNYMFDQILTKELNLTAERLKKINSLVEFGIYRLSNQKTEWFNQNDMDDKIKLLQAACTLPIAGRNVKVNGEWYMDGGVTTMIPIERALEHNVDKIIVVTTKPSNFVRKDNSPMTQFFLDLFYFKYKTLLQDFRKRKDVYNREMNLNKKAKLSIFNPVKISARNALAQLYNKFRECMI